MTLPWNIIPIEPFWKKFHFGQDFLGIKMLFGLFGFLSAFWILPAFLTLNFSNDFFQYFEESSTLFSLFSSLGIQVLLGGVIGFLTIMLIYRYSIVFEGFNLNENFEILKEDIAQTLEEDANDQISLYFLILLLVLFGNGFLTGLLYSFVYVIPIFVVFFLFVLILFNFFSFGFGLFFISFTFSWAIFAGYTSRRKLDIQEEDRKIRDLKIQPITKRELEIATSDDEPIICDYCRSFMPSTSKVCPVCGEDVDHAN